MDTTFVTLLGNYPRIKVLDFLLDNPTSPYAIQDILTHVAISRASAYKIVNELYSMGILKYEGTAARARLYSLNTNNSITVALQNLDATLVVNKGAPQSAKRIEGHECSKPEGLLSSPAPE